MFDNIFCKIKNVDDYKIFRLNSQIYIWFEDTDIKEVVKEINVPKILKLMYNFGKIVYTQLIQNRKLRENINHIEHIIDDKNKIDFVLKYCTDLDILDFEKGTIYSYIYHLLETSNIDLSNLLNPTEYTNWYREIIMYKLCSNINKNPIFIKTDKTTKCYNDIIDLLDKNKNIVNVDDLYNYIQNIKEISLMDHIDVEVFNLGIEQFINYCGLPYYYSDKRHDISYNMQNILDTTATTIPCKRKNAIGRNMLPLNNFINICVFIFVIEESNKGTFSNLLFDPEKILELPYNEKEFNIENLINSYSLADFSNFEYKDLINYLNKINNVIIEYFDSFYNKKLKNTYQKQLKGRNLVNIYNLDNISVYCWKYYFYYFHPHKSVFDDKDNCSDCGKKSKNGQWHYLRGKNKGKKLCEECYKKHYAELNSERVNNYRNKNDRN